MDDFTMLDYMKCKAILGEIILDCPAKFFVSKSKLWHDLAHGFNSVLAYLRKFKNSEQFILKIIKIMDDYLEDGQNMYKEHKDPALYTLYKYGYSCQVIALIYDVLYEFWQVSGSISTDEALNRIMAEKEKGV